ncbi:hypothetical protein [Streptomyces cyaneofuscatus]|uniref:hypothetical protein n=1 Tax=Streptomyces cyaneofuscatus TaxID=66883 RepID=UPI00343F345A
MSRTQMTVTYPDGCQETYGTDREELGVFGSLFTARREREAQRARRLREHRLLQLSRDIEALEAWHHAWRLEYDAGYRELHPGEWCERHRMVRSECVRSHYRQSIDVRSRPTQRVAPELTLEARRAATRTMAKWGSGR